MSWTEKLRNMKVQKKMNVYKTCMILIIVLMGVISAILSIMMNSKIEEITEVWSPSLSLVQEIDTQTSDYRMKQYGHLVAVTEEDMLSYEDELKAIDAKITEIEEKFVNGITTEKEKELFDNAAELWIEYKTQSEEVLRLSRSQNTKKGGELMVADMLTTFQNYQAGFQELKVFETNALNKAKESAHMMFIIMMVVIVIAITAGVVLATILSNTVSGMITEPIKQITEAAGRMHDGDMTARELITYEAEDELGIVAETMRDTMKSLGNYIGEITMNLNHLAKGDLTQPKDDITDFRGDFGEIKESLVYILKRFNSTLAEIQETSDQVAGSSSSISGASQSLSEGATDQASAIQELTATVATVTQLAEESAKSTQESYEKVKKSAEDARYEKQKMEQLTEEMKRITEISKEIANIITAIEDIASQTNLLSLNASIEAARAGDAGKGFAVVADQIGKLAADSAQSAVNTKELISKTLDEIEKGNEITASTSEAFDKIIGGMNEFAEAAHMTNENVTNQARSLEQIEQGIDQISGVMQNTAASSQECSAISENLSDEAAHLHELVMEFKLF